MSTQGRIMIIFGVFARFILNDKGVLFKSFQIIFKGCKILKANSKPS